MEVVHALAVSEFEVLDLARLQDREERLVRDREQRSTDFIVAPARRGLVPGDPRQALAVNVRELEEPADVLLLLRPALHGEEVDDLDEELRLAPRALADDFDELSQPGEEAVVPDAQERSARHVADAGRLDDEDAWTPVGESSVPIEDVARDEPFLDRAPRHHRGHPRARAREDGPEADRAEEAARAGRRLRRPASGRQVLRAVAIRLGGGVHPQRRG